MVISNMISPSKVVNYGIGGHYEPHFDFARVSIPAPLSVSFVHFTQSHHRRPDTLHGSTNHLNHSHRHPVHNSQLNFRGVQALGTGHRGRRDALLDFTQNCSIQRALPRKSTLCVFLN